MTDHLQPMGELGERVTPSRSLSSKSCGGTLKVAVIREEFVELTGDPLIAIILNQLLYWTQRVKDFDLLLEEERSFHPECNVAPRHGWIYKTASELIEETMLRIDRTTMRRYLKFLMTEGWLEERPHPQNKWNKTVQYRLNLRKLQDDLLEIGFCLPGVSFLPQREFSHESQPQASLSEPSPVNARSNGQIALSKEYSAPSKGQIAPSYTYTEITTEITNREHTTRARENSILMVDLWRRYVSQESITLTDERKRRLKDLFSRHFQNDLRQWERFCERIKNSPFLMGEGARRWRVSLDWILSEGNLIKIMEGNFDDPEALDQKKEEATQVNKDQDRSEILASIEDPTWKDWCTQLSRSDLKNVPLSLTVLKDITRAKLGEFDGRLVWIECEDRKSLNHIEDLRFELLSIIQKTFPKARNIRTQLVGTSELPALRSSPEVLNFSLPNTQTERNQSC